MGGVFGDPANWSTGVVPGPANNIRFGINATYAVTDMSAFTVNQTIVNNGVVTFSTQNATPFMAGRLLMGAVGAPSGAAELIISGGSKIDSRPLFPSNPGVYPVGEGVVLGGDASILTTLRVTGAGSRFRVRPLSEFGVPPPPPGSTGIDARFTVGNNARGTAIVSNAGVLQTGTTRIGNSFGASNSLVRITGGGSSWTSSGAIAVGASGAANARLEVQAGAHLTAGALFVGPTGTGEAVFTNPSTTATTSQVILGGSPSRIGNLSILDGATVSSSVPAPFGHLLAQELGSLGQANVATWLVDGTLAVGNRGTGHLLVQLGGSLQSTGDIVVAAETASVGVLTAKSGGLIETTGALIVGPAADGLGDLVVEDAEVQAGVIQVVRGDLAASGGAVVTAGQFNVEEGTASFSLSSLVATGSVSVAAGGSIHLFDSTVTSPQVTNDGSITGTGLLTTPALVNNGFISPGLSPGRLQVTGNYSQSPNGVLKIEGGVGTPGVDFDELVVSGNLSLAGTLDLSMSAGFVPAQGQTFTFVRSTNAGATLSGGFSRITNMAVSSTLSIEPGFAGGALNLVVLPTPTATEILTGIRSGRVEFTSSQTLSHSIALGAAPGKTGELSMAGPGTLSVPGGVTVGGAGGGTLALTNATLAASGAVGVGPAGRVVLQNSGINASVITNQGAFSGTGAIQASLFTNSGELAPGLSPGLLTLGGSFAQDSAGRLKLELAGPVRGSSYDAIDVGGNVSLDGLIKVVAAEGLALVDGQSFEVLRWNGALQGAPGLKFEVLNAPPGFALYPQFTANSLLLTAVYTPADPQPETDASSVLILSPVPGFVHPVGQNLTFNASFVSPLPGVHTATWRFTNPLLPNPLEFTTNASGGTASLVTSFSVPGVYHLQLTITDPSNSSVTTSLVGGDPEAKAHVVIYDANGGWLNGGGWLWSPVGAFALNPSVAGKAEFQLSVRYAKGAVVPTGESSFSVSLAGLNFVSTANEWLIVSGGRAQAQGVGTLNGLPGFGFLLTAVDGDANKTKGEDRLRMKIWDRQTGDIIYDNQPGSGDGAAPNAATVVRGGTLTVHP